MRSAAIGDFSFFTSYMSQPKSQLETFRAWAGIDSDISYYLNSHHVSLGARVSAEDAGKGADGKEVRSIFIVGWSRASLGPSR